MQTIENSLLQVSVDENGAQMVNCVSQNDKFDYLKSQDGQEKVAVAFPAIDQEKIGRSNYLGQLSIREIVE